MSHENELATKADLQALELKIDSKLEAAKAEIIKWNMGTALAAVWLAVAVIKLTS